MSWILTTLSGALYKGGINANSTITADTMRLATWCNEAEDTFCMKTRKDWVTGLAAIPTHLVGCISSAVSDLIGIKIIAADPSGYTGLNEASTMCDILKDDYNDIVKTLAEDQNKQFN